ncbi:cytochrome c oxidase subunit II (plasmid) [Pararobbsia alpina]|uniref:cytochrome c oxidase subunit II n=1 Tax=Pararobbsia alpina TaxID=621374 RepID=UPI0039A65F6D
MVTDRAPLEYVLHAAGPAASPTLRLAWALLALTIVVAIIVTGLLIGALVRRRSRVAHRQLAVDAGGMRWVWIGTGLSTIGLFGALIYMLMTLESVAMPASKPRLVVDVTAYDWWWKIDYPAPSGLAIATQPDKPDASQRPALPGATGTAPHTVTTANELHIPVGEPVQIILHSADVIHAFWVPQLAGKTQAIPGVTNEQWIQADHPGIYRGQCTQFCGEQHAHMAFEVIAQPRAAFDAWLHAQSMPAGASDRATNPAAASNPAPASADADGSSWQAGQKLFGERCAACHTIRGTDAAGVQGPDLTHLNSRETIAAGTLINNEANQLEWITHAQQIKPDALMPSIALDTDDAQALMAYLRRLR